MHLATYYIIIALFLIKFRPAKGVLLPAFVIVLGLFIYGNAGYLLANIEIVRDFWILEDFAIPICLASFLKAGTTISVGYWICSVFIKLKSEQPAKLNLKIIPQAFQALDSQKHILYIITIIWALTVLTARGWNNIFAATEYHQIDNPLLLGITSPFGIVILLLIGIISGNKFSLISILVALLCWSTFMIDASRGMIVGASCYFLGILAVKFSKKENPALILVIQLICTTWLLPKPLELRSLQQHDVFTYIETIFKFNTETFNDQVFESLTNLFSGFSTTAWTIQHRNELPINYFWVEISPLPSVINNWVDVAGDLVVRKGVPYTGVGSLELYGTLVLMIYGFAMGLLLRLTDLICSKLPANQITLWRMAIAAMAVFSVGLLSQYPIRSATRISYYSFFVVCLFFIIKKFFDLSDGKRVNSTTKNCRRAHEME